MIPHNKTDSNLTHPLIMNIIDLLPNPLLNLRQLTPRPLHPPLRRTQKPLLIFGEDTTRPTTRPSPSPGTVVQRQSLRLRACVRLVHGRVRRGG